MKGQIAGRNFHHGTETGRFQSLAVFDTAGDQCHGHISGIPQNPEGHFPLQSLGIRPAFTGYHQTGAFDGLGEMDQFQDTADTGDHPGPQIGHKGATQAPGRSGAGHLPDVHPGLFLHTGRQAQHTRFQHFHLFRRSSFLRSKYPCCAGRPHKGSVYIAEKFQRGEVPDTRDCHHTGAAVTDGAAAKAYQKVSAAFGAGGHQQFTHAPAGGDERLTLLRPEQRKPAGLGYFDNGRFPSHAIAGPYRTAQRIRNRNFTEARLQGWNQHVQSPFPTIGQRKRNNFGRWIYLIYSLRHGPGHLSGRQTFLERIRCKDDFHRDFR